MVPRFLQAFDEPEAFYIGQKNFIPASPAKVLLFALIRLTQVVCLSLTTVVMEENVMIAIVSATCSTPVARVKFPFLKLCDSLKLNQSACPLFIHLQNMQMCLYFLLTPL